MSIRRLLIANRGEIAVRIVAACRELGIETIAVYSAADKNAPHVAAADRAVAIGPAPAVDSYLSIPRVVDAARQSGADDPRNRQIAVDGRCRSDRKSTRLNSSHHQVSRMPSSA